MFQLFKHTLGLQMLTIPDIKTLLACVCVFRMCISIHDV